MSDPAPEVVALDEEIQLAPGDRVAFGPQRLAVEFVRVVSDSRCPKDTTCVWAGEVIVQLSARVGKAQAVQHEVRLGESAKASGLRIIVWRIQPEATSTRPIAPEEYQVTLTATADLKPHAAVHRQHGAVDVAASFGT